MTNKEIKAELYSINKYIFEKFISGFNKPTKSELKHINHRLTKLIKLIDKLESRK